MTDKLKEAIQLADTIDRSEETTGFERRMASVMRELIAENERLKSAIFTDNSITVVNCEKRIAELEDELENERRKVTELVSGYEKDAATIKELREEVERLNLLLKDTLLSHMDTLMRVNNDPAIYNLAKVVIERLASAAAPADPYDKEAYLKETDRDTNQ